MPSEHSELYMFNHTEIGLYYETSKSCDIRGSCYIFFPKDKPEASGISWGKFALAVFPDHNLKTQIWRMFNSENITNLNIPITSKKRQKQLLGFQVHPHLAYRKSVQVQFTRLEPASIPCISGLVNIWQESHFWFSFGWILKMTNISSLWLLKY